MTPKSEPFFTEESFGYIDGNNDTLTLDVSQAAYMANAKIAPLLARIEELEEHLQFALSFCPQSIAPKWVDPTFYHTLTFEGDLSLSDRLEKARAALGKGEE